jgi:hypothetical protein
MMGTPTAQAAASLTLAQIARLASELASAAATLARLAGAEAAPPAAPTPPRALPRHVAALRAEMAATTTAWMRARVATWPGDRSIPSMQDDVEAAAIELPGVPQRYIRAARWPGWRRGPGRPRKSGKI